MYRAFLSSQQKSAPQGQVAVRHAAWEPANLFQLPTLLLALIVCAFIALHCFLPLATAVKIGADEDFELSKATLCLKGFHLYTEIWNDQPPLDTFIITQVLKHISLSVLGPRLLTVSFAVLLLAATFALVQRVSGPLSASLATVMLLASPGFLELSSSCMQEIPALGPAVAGLAVLWIGRRERTGLAQLLGGLLFGIALQMKLLDAIYLPIAALVIWLRCREADLNRRKILSAWTVFGVAVVASFLALNYLTGNSLLIQFRESWAAHFASSQSFEYGSPADRPFDWAVLLRNWDTTVPALVGIAVLLREARACPATLLPLGWLALTLVIFPFHKPWWAYYYVHNALPLCWCAGIGLGRAWGHLRSERARGRAILVAVFTLCATGWMGARIYLEQSSVRSSPRLYSCLVLKEIERFKPYTTFMFSDQPIFTFHAQIPMPPHLAVISLKRLWSGDMSNRRLTAELESVKPGLILLGNNGLEVPYQALLNRDYRLVYRDSANLLYAHQSIARKPGF